MEPVPGTFQTYRLRREGGVRNAVRRGVGLNRTDGYRYRTAQMTRPTRATGTSQTYQLTRKEVSTMLRGEEGLTEPSDTATQQWR